MKVSFELTMPNNNSWNGKWSGEGSNYYIIMPLTQKAIDSFMKGKERESWYYNFGDGWGACVIAEIVDDEVARKRKRISKGFCGYDWMISSILVHGDIYNTEQRKALHKITQ